MLLLLEILEQEVKAAWADFNTGHALRMSLESVLDVSLFEVDVFLRHFVRKELGVRRRNVNRRRFISSGEHLFASVSPCL